MIRDQPSNANAPHFKFLRRKVLQLMNSFHQGGSERQAVQLLRLLVSNGTCDLFVACLNDEGVLRNEVEAVGFREICEYKIPSFFSMQYLAQARRCAKFIRSKNIEIVQTHDFYTNVFGMTAAAMAGVKLKIGAKRETGGMRSKNQEYVEKLAFRQSNVIIANSAAVKEYLVAKRVFENKIRVIYNGLDLDRLKPTTLDRTEICQSLGLPKEPSIKFVTMVANLRHTVKNQPMLLRAAKNVVEKFPEAHFVFAGEGELKTDLEKMAKELNIENNTHFIGLCRKIPELLSISYAGVLTSFSEGFSNSILEYMAAGKPVIATRVGGASEAVIENESGFLITPEDDAALISALNEVLGNEKKSREFGAKGKEIVAEKFSLAAQLGKTLEIYDSF